MPSSDPNSTALATSLSTIWGGIPSPTQLPQIQHRLQLLQHFSLFQPSSTTTSPRILEIGCGQGDTTACLLGLLTNPTDSTGAGADTKGHVTALDPGPPDYGSPLTLSQAQSLVTTRFGASNVTFIHGDAVTYAASLPPSEGKPFDAAVLVKSLWYFPSREAVVETLTAARKVAERVFIAEYALSSRDGAGEAHVLVSRAWGGLYDAAMGAAAAGGEGEDVKDVREMVEGFLGGSNVRVALAPAELKRLAGDAGLRLVSEGVVECEAELQDGRWDVGGALQGKVFMERVERVEKIVGRLMEVRGLYQAAKDAVLELAGEKGGDEKARMKSGLKEVKTMDVWVAEFEA